MKFPAWLFWMDWLQKIIWKPFWWVIMLFIILWIPFLRMWWWFFLPIMLHQQLRILYRWWIAWDYNYPSIRWAVFEFIPPQEILTPVKAMEDIFNVMWTIYDSGNFREQWVEGTLETHAAWCSWEIVSTEGKIHFYLRIPAQHKTGVEMAFFNHYPEIEIREVSDYVRLVPPTVPNDEWDTYGEDFDFTREDAYPIKTYEKFFEPQGEKIAAEEKRMDPIISLLEGMSKLGVGEHYWVQFITGPITDDDEPTWREVGKEIVAKTAKRPIKQKATLQDDLVYAAKQLIFGPKKEGSGDKVSYEWEPQFDEDEGADQLKITPAEKEIVTEVENKLRKPAFATTVRGVYVAKRENWVPAHRILLKSYLAHFSSGNMNMLFFQSATRPKIHYFWRSRRTFLRARKMFRNAVMRFPPLFPERGSQNLQPILSAEEMATLYHFPVKLTGMLAPSLSKIEAKKSGPPSNLPIE